MTTDDKAFEIAAWYYDSPKENLLGYPVEPEMYNCIEFLWPVAKEIYQEINRIANEENPSYMISQLPGTIYSIKQALGSIDEEKIIDVIYTAITKLKEYEQINK